MLENVTIKVKHLCAVGIERHSPYGWKVDPGAEWPHDSWHVTLGYKGKSYTLPEYNTGIGWRLPARNEPRGYYQGPETAIKKITAKDVLESLFSDAGAAYDTFEGWCGDMGLDTDSRKALDTYLACQATATALRKLFGADFGTIQREVNDNA